MVGRPAVPEQTDVKREVLSVDERASTLIRPERGPFQPIDDAGHAAGAVDQRLSQVLHVELSAGRLGQLGQGIVGEQCHPLLGAQNAHEVAKAPGADNAPSRYPNPSGKDTDDHHSREDVPGRVLRRESLVYVDQPSSVAGVDPAGAGRPGVHRDPDRRPAAVQPGLRRELPTRGHCAQGGCRLSPTPSCSSPRSTTDPSPERSRTRSTGLRGHGARTRSTTSQPR